MLTLMLALLCTAQATRLEEPGAADAVRYAAELIELGRHEEAEGILRDMLADAPPALRGVSEEERVREALKAADDGEVAVAVSTLREVAERSAGQPIGVRASRLMDELAVIGRILPELKASRWLRGDAPTARTQVWLFLESWCPHCGREAPRFEGIARAWAEQGVDVVVATRLSQDSTDRDMKRFLSEHGLSVPVAVDDGSISAALGVTGVPAVAVVHDGAVAWRGHPSRFHEGRIRALATTPSDPAGRP